MFLVLVLVSLICCSFAQNPGIRLEVTEKGLTDIKILAQQFIEVFILENQPFPLPDQSITFLSATNLSVGNITFQTFEFDLLNGQGIQMKLLGLQFNLAYIVNYDLGIISGSFPGRATVSNTNFTGLFSLKKTEDGHLSITLSNVNLNIGSLDPGFPSDIIEELVKLVSGLIADILDSVLPGMITQNVNSQLADVLNSLPMTQFLDPGKTIVLDYSLITDPQVTSDEIVVQAKGDIHWVSQPSCGLPYNTITSSQSDDLRIYVSGTLADCLLNALQQSGTGTSLINSLITQYLHLDNRMSLVMNFTQGSYVAVTPSGINATITFDVGFQRNFYNPELYISMLVNISTLATIGIHGNFNITGQLSSLTTELGMDYVAADVPDTYQQEIQNTNFQQLSDQANNFIQTAVLPAVNPLLAAGYVISPLYTLYFTNPVMQFGDEFIFIGLDIVPPTISTVIS